MELSKTGAVKGMQDMGAAGITCSTSEMSAGGNVGMDIWLDKVPTRQEGMEPWEILLSESQERMLVVVDKGREKDVQSIFEKWDIHCEQIGIVTDGPLLRYYWNKKKIAEIPAESLVLGGGAPVYHRESKEPAYFSELKKFNIESVNEPDNLFDVAKKIMALPNISSKKWVYEQYDSMVGTKNRSTNDPSDAAIVNIKGSKRALAMTVDCNSRYVNSDPEVGTMIAVSENARNIICSGAEPSAITNCLNFGNPYNPEVYWQFIGAIKGMTKACKKFTTPVTGGNVSFYNQTKVGDSTVPIFPTPTIAMIGLVKNIDNITTIQFKCKGDLIYQIGPSVEDISSSQYLVNIHNITESPAPSFDLDQEFLVQDKVKKLIKKELVSSAHDVSEGGLFVTLMESAMISSYGFNITSDSSIRKDAYLFGESQSRIIVSVSPEKEDELIDIMMSKDVDFHLVGHVTKGSVRVDDENWGDVNDYKTLYDNALGAILEE